MARRPKTEYRSILGRYMFRISVHWPPFCDSDPDVGDLYWVYSISPGKMFSDGEKVNKRSEKYPEFNRQSLITEELSEADPFEGQPGRAEQVSEWKRNFEKRRMRMIGATSQLELWDDLT